MKKLNLGCGEKKQEGYINIDREASLSPEIVHDLNKFPYPFEDNEIDEVYASHVLEHLDRPFLVMAELHRIMKPGGKLLIKVPHFSRGFTHAEHFHGFDVTFALYFNKNFSKSGYTGKDFELESIKMRWLAFFHLMYPYNYSKFIISALKFLNVVISGLANLNVNFCSRIWCFWVGGFDEIEFKFKSVK